MLKMNYSSVGGIQEIETLLGNTSVGRLTWDEDEVIWVEVLEQYRRCGIGRRMWDYSQTFAIPARHSPCRSRLGDLWARSVGGELPTMADDEDSKYAMSFLDQLDMAGGAW